MSADPTAPKLYLPEGAEASLLVPQGSEVNPLPSVSLCQFTGRNLSDLTTCPDHLDGSCRTEYHHDATVAHLRGVAENLAGAYGAARAELELLRAIARGENVKGLNRAMRRRLTGVDSRMGPGRPRRAR